MPSARQSTFSMCMVSRSSLSHWMIVRSGIAAFSTGTISLSEVSEITKPPTCCDRCLGMPRSSSVSFNTRRRTGLSGSKPHSRNRSPGVLSPQPRAKMSLSWPT